MNIGIVCYPTYGGSGVVATELGMALAKKGHNVHFITYAAPTRLDMFQPNVFYHEVSFQNYTLFEYPPYETALASNIVDVVKYQKLDIVHVHYAIPHASAAYIAKQILMDDGIDLKVVTTLHGTDITLVGKLPSYRPVVAFSINKSDCVTTEIEVIPNFIDFNRFSKLDKDHFKKAIAPNGEKVLIHVSNFRKVKRVDDVVKVFHKIAKGGIKAKLLLVGDGPERSAIEQIIRELDLCDKVTFLGKQEKVEELLAVSDLFLMPSESESFGLAALEAMACEVPVISSNAGGISEINIHNLTGFLSDVGDVNDMAKNAILLLENEQMLADFKQNALAQAKTFHIDKILPIYEECYIQTLKG